MDIIFHNRLKQRDYHLDDRLIRGVIVKIGACIQYAIVRDVYDNLQFILQCLINTSGHLGCWFYPTQGHVSALSSPHCPLRLFGPV